VFAVCVILLEILVCLIHGLSFRLREDVMTTVPDYAGILLISILTILTIVGTRIVIQDSGSSTPISADLP
jgi:hypothetical protein